MTSIFLAILLVLPLTVNIAFPWMIDGEGPSFVGVWKGDSVCQIKDSPCHDEVSVYTVTKGAERDTFQMTMNKVVDGKEQTMGVVGCKAGAEAGSYVCRLNEFTVWSWKLDKDELNGNLQYRSQLYRKIHMTRSG